MNSENTTKPQAIKLKPDKLERLKKVRRTLSAVEDRDLSDVGLLDEILDEGLTRLEKRLGDNIKPKNHEAD